MDAKTEPAVESLTETGIVDMKPATPAPPLPFDPNKAEEVMPLRSGDENTGQIGRPDRTRMTAAGCTPFYNANQNRTYTLCGEILDKYMHLGGPGGFLGEPISDEIWNPDGAGKRAAFENNSSIYWRPGVGAFQIGGSIGARWAELDYENSPLGYPTTDEITDPDGVGKRNWFQGGTIYWQQATGAWEVWGQILAKWALDGYETYWGYPTGPEVGPGATPSDGPSYGGYSQPFHHGRIYWNVVPPVCGEMRVDAVHDSSDNPGTLNVHVGIPGNPAALRCNRPVKEMGFEVRMWNHGLKGLPYPYQLHQDWTAAKGNPIKDKRNAITNVTGGPCEPLHKRRMSADGRGYMIDYDGVSYAIPEKESIRSTVICR